MASAITTKVVPGPSPEHGDVPTFNWKGRLTQGCWTKTGGLCFRLNADAGEHWVIEGSAQKWTPLVVERRIGRGVCVCQVPGRWEQWNWLSQSSDNEQELGAKKASDWLFEVSEWLLDADEVRADPKILPTLGPVPWDFLSELSDTEYSALQVSETHVVVFLWYPKDIQRELFVVQHAREEAVSQLGW